MSATAAWLLAKLRRLDARIEVDGTNLRVVAPRGIVTAEERVALRDHKPEILEQLRLESQLLGMSLDEFAAQGLAIETGVPWLTETLWFVPGAEYTETLVRKGVSRGRIWTVGELRDLASISALTTDDVATIGRLKAEFGADVLRVEREGAKEGAPSSRRCPACHDTRFWRSVRGVTVCATCHPPAAPHLVVEWIDAAGDPDGTA